MVLPLARFGAARAGCAANPKRAPIRTAKVAKVFIVSKYSNFRNCDSIGLNEKTTAKSWF
jgi:hypothetical protein